MTHMELTKNVPINFKFKPISESMMICRFKTKSTKSPVRIDLAVHIYYQNPRISNGNSIVGNVQSAYTSDRDMVHEIKILTPKFDKYVKSDFLLYLAREQGCDKVSIEDIQIGYSIPQKLVDHEQKKEQDKNRELRMIAAPRNIVDKSSKRHKIQASMVMPRKSTKIILYDQTDIFPQMQMDPLILGKRIVGKGQNIDGPKIAIASIVRNEEANGNLIKFLDCCRELEKYHKNLLYIFIEGDSLDRTYDTLEDWVKERDCSILENIDMSYAPFMKDRNTVRTAFFAQLRNRLIEIILSIPDITEILMIDANYEWKGDLIELLRETGADIAAPLTVTHKDNKGKFLFYDTWVFRKDGKEFWSVYPYSESMKFNGPIDVDSVGGGYLMNREVLDAGVIYNGDTDSEQVGFCNYARGVGFSIKINPKAYIKKIILDKI